MFSKFLVLTLFTLHCLIEVKGTFISTVNHHIPLVKTVSGISDVSVFPYSSYISPALPLSYGYGYGLSGLNGYGLNYGYLNNLHHSVFAPSVVSYAPSVLHRERLFPSRLPSIQTYSSAQPDVVQRDVVVDEPQTQIMMPSGGAIEGHAIQNPVSAPIQQVGRTVEYKEVPINFSAVVPQHVVVEPSNQPIHIHFRSRSSTVSISQEHIPGERGTVAKTQSVEEPSIARHEVVKPVIQEVREMIQPYRRITQEILPVVENVHRVVAKGVGKPLVEETGQENKTTEEVEPVDTQSERRARLFRKVVRQRIDPNVEPQNIEPQVRVEGNALNYDARDIREPEVRDEQRNEDLVKYFSSQ